MAKSRKLEAALAQIKEMQQLETLAAEDIVALRNIIQGKQPMAIAPTTKLIIRHRLVQLIPDLSAAFERLLRNGEKTDPGCKAKWAIANTLYQLEQPEAALFLAGIRHIQKEPVWGGTTDTAPPLRSLCALGLVQANYPQALSELADLLADAEHDARAGAARAVGYSQNPAGIPLLRLKVHLGDSEPQVLSECFIALLQLSEEQAPLVIESLTTGSEPVQALAALALGEARIPAAFDPIKQQWQRTRAPELRQSFLLAIASLRTAEAIAFLIDLLERGNAQDAQDALITLDIYRHTTEIWQQVTKVVQRRDEASLVAMLKRAP
ncbi:MAG: HEAT repeat domain-containing protein [Phormidesmis sp.]